MFCKIYDDTYIVKVTSIEIWFGNSLDIKGTLIYTDDKNYKSMLHKEIFLMSISEFIHKRKDYNIKILKKKDVFKYVL